MAYRGGGPEPGRRERHREEWLDVVFEILADARRRFLLAYLRDRRDTTFGELADVVTGWEQARRGNGIATSAERDRIAARLHHVDLPKLAAAGVVEYDPDAGRIDLVEVPAPLDDFLAAASGWQAEKPDGEDERTNRRDRR